MSWLEETKTGLERLHRGSMHRTLRVFRKTDGVSVEVDDHCLMNLSGNDYLGLSQEPEVMETAIEALHRWGAGTGASRLITGTNRLHAELEEEFADFKGSSSALVFPTGYQASLGVVTSLASSDDVVFVDRLAHSCLVDGARLSGAKLRVFPHSNVERLDELLRSSKSFRRRLILADGVYSMDGDIAPLPELLSLADRYDAIVVLDDAHATGVIGKTGRGTAEHFEVNPREHEERLVIIATMSKALGSQGGAALCAPVVRDWLVNKARTFIYTTALAPAQTASALAGLRVLEREPERVQKLQRLAATACIRLQQAGLDTMRSETAIIPVRTGTPDDALAASRTLQDRGFLALPIRPPTVPRGTSRLRLSISASLTEQTLQNALDSIAQVCQPHPVEGGRS